MNVHWPSYAQITCAKQSFSAFQTCILCTRKDNMSTKDMIVQILFGQRVCLWLLFLPFAEISHSFMLSFFVMFERYLRGSLVFTLVTWIPEWFFVLFSLWSSTTNSFERSNKMWKPTAGCPACVQRPPPHVSQG